MIEKTPYLTIAQATRFALRFREMPGFPQEEVERRNASGELEAFPGPGQEALIRAFQSVARGQAHAERICRLLEDGVRIGTDENAGRFAPQAVDIRHAALRLAEGHVPEYDGRKPVRCNKCDDTGFVRIENVGGCSAVEYCTCHPAYKPSKRVTVEA